MFYAIAVVAVQVMTLIHVVRTGRTQPWLMIVLFLPLVGSIAYLVAEVLPEFLGQGAGQRARAAAQDLIDPERTLRELQDEAVAVDTPQAYARVAKELARLRRFADSVSTFERAMTGIFADDPELLYASAEAAFDGAEAGQLAWSQAREALNRLESIEPKFRAKDRALFRARLAAESGNAEDAEREYRELTKGHAAFEVRVRYAHFLYTQRRFGEARDLLSELLAQANRSSPHVRQMNAEWISQAETAFTVVTSAIAKG